jgi:hypothetical protein
VMIHLFLHNSYFPLKNSSLRILIRNRSRTVLGVV